MSSWTGCPSRPDLTMTALPAEVRFGDTIQVQGRLTADGGYPVPGHPVSINFPGGLACYAITSDNGSYFCDMYITSHIKSGTLNVNATYEADDVPGEALANAASPNVTLYVIQVSYVADAG